MGRSKPFCSMRVPIIEGVAALLYQCRSIIQIRRARKLGFQTGTFKMALCNFSAPLVLLPRLLRASTLTSELIAASRSYAKSLNSQTNLTRRHWNHSRNDVHRAFSPIRSWEDNERPLLRRDHFTGGLTSSKHETPLCSRP